MKKIDINVQTRTAAGKGAARSLRRQGSIPAIIYGAGQDNALLAVDGRELQIALRSGAAKTVVTLMGEGGGQMAIIKETQYDALGDHLEHVDFLRVLPDKPVHLSIPVTTTGKAAGEALGGILEHLTREVRVECFPNDIPDNIVVDITPVGVGEGVHLRDLTPPAGVKFVDPPDTALVVVKASRMAKATTAEEEAAAAAAAAAAEGAEGETAEGAAAAPAGKKKE